MYARLLTALLLTGFVANAGCRGYPGQGNEGAVCFEDGTCRDGLVCVRMQCVRTCGDGECAAHESHADCPQDCPFVGCGDGVAEGAELCDGTDLRGASCVSLDPVRHSGGVLGCDEGCALDTSGCFEQDTVTLQGAVWSPGADLPGHEEHKIYPVPRALILAYPDGPPTGRVPDCEQVPPGIPHTYGDPVDGAFSLELAVSTSYYLTIQKGRFWRTRLITTPDTPDATFVLGSYLPGEDRPEPTTLPHSQDPAAGDRIPRIAIVVSEEETLEKLFIDLGFNPAVDLELVGLKAGHQVDREKINAFLHDLDRMNDYDIILVGYDEHWPGTQTATDNVRQWVRDGGTLWANDASYDYVEQPFPAFLSFYTPALDIGSDDGVCGEGALPPEPFLCSNWVHDGTYVGTLVTDDPDLDAWLTLTASEVDESTYFDNFWCSLHDVHPGQVGEDAEGEPLIELPTVLMRHEGETPAGVDVPSMVWWPYYEGRVGYFAVWPRCWDDYPWDFKTRVFWYFFFGGTDC